MKPATLPLEVRATSQTRCPLCSEVVSIRPIADHDDGVEWSGRACPHFRQFDIYRKRTITLSEDGAVIDVVDGPLLAAFQS